LDIAFDDRREYLRARNVEHEVVKTSDQLFGANAHVFSLRVFRIRLGQKVTELSKGGA
jgi:hypothetical protein